MDNDWDLVSDAVASDDATDPSDAVSTPPPRRRRRHGQSGEVSPSRGFVLLGLAGLLIASLASGVTWFVVSCVSGTHGANSTAITAAATEAVTSIDMNATATAQAVATTTTAQQIYTQATSGTPAVDDPLSDDRNGWDVVSNSWGGQCTFTGGAYHLILPKPGYEIICTGGVMSALNNSADFALQVQINIMQGSVGGVYFGNASYGSYSVDIYSSGTYHVNRYVRSNDKTYVLQSHSSSAIKAGLNQVNMVTVIVNNKNLYLDVNGQFVTTAYLSDYSQGDGGFGAHSFDQAADVAFSNLKIWTL